MNDDLMIRTARADDWPAIWPFFKAIVDERETYAFPLDLTSDAGRALWMETAPGHTVVLTERDHVLGTAKMGPNRPGVGDHIGTASFMVERAARGRGVGSRLVAYVIDWHRKHDFAGIQFNAVVETNASAIKLWRSHGFEIIGTVPGAFRSPAHGPVGLHVMFLDLRDNIRPPSE